MKISDTAIAAIRSNNKLMGRLMGAFDRGQNTIENWCVSKDVRLTTPTAVQIISEETGLNEKDILDDSVDSKDTENSDVTERVQS